MFFYVILRNRKNFKLLNSQLFSRSQKSEVYLYNFVHLRLNFWRMFPIVMLVWNKIKVKLHCHYREKDIEKDKERQRNSISLCNKVSDEVTKFSKFQIWMFMQLTACSTQITASEDMVTWFYEKQKATKY